MTFYSRRIHDLKKYFADRSWFDVASHAILLLAVVFPLIMITRWPKLYHASDVDDLWRWSRSWSADWRNIYIDCDRCNYPFVGTFVSAGVMSLSGIDNFEGIVQPFRYYLGVMDGINVILIYWVLKKMQVKHAPLWAGIIGLLPSFWIGSSIWGQIDGLGLMLILLTFILFISFNLEERPGPLRYYLFIFGIGLLLSFSILFKQLIIFSLLSVALMSIANIFALHSRDVKPLLAGLLLLLFSTAAPIVLIDSVLNLRPPFISHLQYVWETGSQHGDTISSFGFNIWIFLTDNPVGSSHDVINLGLTPRLSIPIIPYNLGMALFLLSTSAFSLYFLKYLISKFGHGRKFFDREVILGFLLHLALVNLSFNLFLTGTHERYLYYFYPFLIMAYLGLENYDSSFNRKLLCALMMGPLFYGWVLYTYLNGNIKAYGDTPFKALSIFHLVLFIFLLALFMRHFKPQRV